MGNYGGGNQFNIESIVLNVNAPSRFRIASTTIDGADKEDYEEVVDDRIGRHEVSGESSPLDSEDYDYDNRQRHGSDYVSELLEALLARVAGGRGESSLPRRRWHKPHWGK